MVSLIVDENGTELSYVDSGAPKGATNYVTIFAIHGTVFTGREYSASCLIARVHSE